MHEKPHTNCLLVVSVSFRKQKSFDVFLKDNDESSGRLLTGPPTQRACSSVTQQEEKKKKQRRSRNVSRDGMKRSLFGHTGSDRMKNDRGMSCFPT